MRIAAKNALSELTHLARQMLHVETNAGYSCAGVPGKIAFHSSRVAHKYSRSTKGTRVESGFQFLLISSLKEPVFYPCDWVL